MVFLQFPSKLTEEEQMLQAKYAKLRRVRKKLTAVLNAKNNPEAANAVPGTISGTAGSVTGTVKKLGSGPEAKTAKEMAKKMLRDGTISLKKNQETDKHEKCQGFKRSQGLERKLTGMDARVGYQPFSATHGPSGGFDTGGEDMDPEPAKPPPKKVKNLYDSFVSARDREERGLSVREGNKGERGHRTGNTIYVSGFNVSEEILRNCFSTNGKIVNISMEVEKNCGFVTFDKPEAAEQAILDHNSTVVQGIQLKVTMARRQPVIEPINDASSSTTWSTLAASHSQKGSHKDKRELVTYDEDIF